MENTRWISAVAVSSSGTLIAAVDNLKTLFIYCIKRVDMKLNQPELVLKKLDGRISFLIVADSQFHP